FRPENLTIYLCRPFDTWSTDSVLDIIMMIADPDNLQTSDQENHNLKKAGSQEPQNPPLESKKITQNLVAEPEEYNMPRMAELRESGFNPFNLQDSSVDFDLK